MARVSVAPRALVRDLAATAITRLIAASFAFQLPPAGSFACCCNSAVAYAPTLRSMASGNLLVSALASSHAAFRRVSASLPSTSRRAYSTQFISNSSRSSSRNCTFGITIDSQICLSVSSSPNRPWCTELATAVRNLDAEATTRSRRGSRPVRVSSRHASPTNVCKKRWNSSSFFSTYRLILSHTAALTSSSAFGAESSPVFASSAATSAGSGSSTSSSRKPPNHASMASSNTSGSSWEFSEKNTRHERRAQDSKAMNRARAFGSEARAPGFDAAAAVLICSTTSRNRAKLGATNSSRTYLSSRYRSSVLYASLNRLNMALAVVRTPAI